MVGVKEIREDSEVTVIGGGERGTVLCLTGDGQAQVVFDGGFTQVLPLEELRLAEEA